MSDGFALETCGGCNDGWKWRRTAIAVCAALLTMPVPTTALAEDVHIHGVRAAAIELPSIYGLLRRPGDDSGGFLDQNGDASTAFKAFLDTGTSGIVLTKEYGEELGVIPYEFAGELVTFSDVAANGTVDYSVSEPLHLQIGRYTGETFEDIFDPVETNQYFDQITSNVRIQLSRSTQDPFLPPLNLIGMPALMNKSMVVDARLYNHITGIDDDFNVRYTPQIESLADFPASSLDVPLPMVQTWVYDKGDTTDRSATPLFNPGTPSIDHTVRLSYSDFSRFTTITPDGAESPVLEHNPFIGPAPLTTPTAGDPPGITARRLIPGNTEVSSATGSWLLDTGAQLSFMSSATALALGIELTYDDDGNPSLIDLATGLAPAGIFEVPLAGADGEAGSIMGFTLEELVLPTTDGSITFHDVPIGVFDVTVFDGEVEYTLPGIFGMNLLLPSFDVDTDNATGSQFDFFTFDEQDGLLHLTNSTVAVPEPLSGILVFAGGALLMRRRRS